MPVSVFSAARHLCEQSGWTVSNLKLQKIIFLAHMVHLGEKQRPLITEGFQAWDYGPVSHPLYQRVKAFGSSPIRNVFHGDPTISDSDALEVLNDVYRQVGGWSAGRLVDETHRPNGAWERTYIPGAMGIPIPDDVILAEYRARLAEQGPGA